jgi:hypothetical protein
MPPISSGLFALGDHDQRRAQHAVGDQVALLQHGDHGVGFLSESTMPMAWCLCGSNFSPAGLTSFRAFFSKAETSCLRVSSTPA